MKNQQKAIHILLTMGSSFSTKDNGVVEYLYQGRQGE